MVAVLRYGIQFCFILAYDESGKCSNLSFSVVFCFVRYFEHTAFAGKVDNIAFISPEVTQFIKLSAGKCEEKKVT